MNYKLLTKWVIIFSVVALAVYDVYTISMGGLDTSISYLIQGWSMQYPAVTLATGILLGHLFWPIRKKLTKEDVEKFLIEEEIKKSLK